MRDTQLKAYHAQKSREWYHRQSQDTLDKRMLYRAQQRRDKKAKAVQEFGATCAHCKHTFPDAVFDFHHRDPLTKDVTPAKLFMCSDKRIKDELSKCIMLCANCHRIEHSLKYINERYA